jgi:hypothetical protein
LVTGATSSRPEKIRDKSECWVIEEFFDQFYIFLLSYSIHTAIKILP